MSDLLKTLMMKLKKRRKSTTDQQMCTDQGHEDRQLEVERIAEGMAELNLTPLFSKEASPTTTIVETFGLDSLEDFKSDFKSESSSTWPGPQYDDEAQFAPGVLDQARPFRPKSKKSKASKRRNSSQEVVSTTLRSKHAAKVKAGKEAAVRSKKTSQPLQHYGTPAPRNPPTHLLTLPGEIRNQIYRLLTVRDQPIVAQFRHIKGEKRGTRHFIPTETLRRFPREPVLTLGCRQLQREVLSIFYGENKFIFRPSLDARLKVPGATWIETMQKWSPAPNIGMADCLKHIEVHFNIRLILGSKEHRSIDYVFRRFAEGRLRLSSDADEVGESHCMCFDQRLLAQEKVAIKARELPCDDLITEATRFIQRRASSLAHDETMVETMVTIPPTFRSRMAQCKECGNGRMVFLEGGM